jgi:C1A family cysteine protease
MKTQRYGWVRDLPDRRDLMYAPPPEVGAALPPSVDLRSGFPPCYDQGHLGSCTANAIAGALQYVERKEGDTSPLMPSRLFIYFNERAMEGSVTSDSGAQIRDGIKSVVKQGYCSEDRWPYEIGQFAAKPPDQCYQEALSDRVSQYLRLPNIHRDTLLTCLASGYPFVCGFTVYDSFESPEVAKSGVVALPKPSEGVLGGHAVLAVGYDMAAGTFLVRNSWGEKWGKNGYFTMPFAYLTDPHLASDFWTIRKVPIQ